MRRTKRVETCPHPHPHIRLGGPSTSPLSWGLHGQGCFLPIRLGLFEGWDLASSTRAFHSLVHPHPGAGLSTFVVTTGYKEREERGEGKGLDKRAGEWKGGGKEGEEVSGERSW